MTLKTAEAERMLRQWALWSVTSTGIKLNYPSIEPFTKMISVSGGEPVTISDDDGVKIDSVIAGLADQWPKEAESLIVFYRSRENMSEVSRRMKISMRAAENNVSFAIGYISGVLFSSQ